MIRLFRSATAGLIAGLIAITAMPHNAVAQAVRGMVVDAGGIPVPGVVIQLVGTDGTVAARALSDEGGVFFVATMRPGSYQVRTLRIGWRPSLSTPIALAAGQEVRQRFEVTGVTFALDTVRVGSTSQCRLNADSAAATFKVWEQVRTALSATQLTEHSRGVMATTVLFERTLDHLARPTLAQSATLQTDYAKQPWLTLSADSLRRIGYVVFEGDEAVTFHAPGLEMLLSDGFVEDHCFKLTSGRDTRLLGVAFEPTSARKQVAEIRGTVWLDRASSELRSMEFRYVNASPEQEQEGGGGMEFVRMRDGAWAISRWSIRMPVVQQVVRRRALGGTQPQISEIRITGGELSIAKRGNDTLWSRPPMTFTGVVLDSASGAPVAGARTMLTPGALSAVSDAAGRFGIGGVIPGQYTLDIRTASLDSLNAAHQVPLAITDSGPPLRFRVPNAGQLARLLCSGAAGRPAATNRQGIVIGSVRTTRDSSLGIVGVIAEWSEPSGNAYATGTKTDARGNFRLCNMPVGTTMIVRATPDNGSASPALVRVSAESRLARLKIEVDPLRAGLAVFTGSVVNDTTFQPLAGVEVTLPALAQSTVTDARGLFRIPSIPPGTHRVVARRVGYAPLDVAVTFEANRAVEQRIVLRRFVTLDSVVIVGAAAPHSTFDEHRKLGLGHFITSDELERQSGVPLAGIMTTVPGSAIARGRGTQGWILGKRAPAFLPGQDPPPTVYFPEPFEKRQGMPAGCYAKVYLDRILMNPGLPTPAFDVNSIRTDELEAVEFYAGPSQTPMEYADLNSSCGVLVLWRKRYKSP